MKKRILLGTLIIMTCFVLTGCGDTTTSEKAPQEVAISSVQENTAGNNKTIKKEANFEEQVILDKNDIKITAKEIDYSGWMGPEIKLLIENNSTDNIIVQDRNVSINDIMVMGSLSENVVAGKKSNTSLYIDNADLKTAKITTIKDIELSLLILKDGSWEELFTEEGIKLQTDAKNYSQEYNTDGFLAVDQNDIKIYVLKLVDEDSFWGKDICLYIENNSNKEVAIQVDDVSINGFMIDPSFSAELKPGKKAYDSIVFFKEDLQNNGITDIDSIELKFTALDNNSWDTIFETNDITIKF